MRQAHAAELAPLIEATPGLDQAPGTVRVLVDARLTAGKVLVYLSRRQEQPSMTECEGLTAVVTGGAAASATRPWRCSVNIGLS